MARQIKIDPQSPFTIHNIPYGIISTEDNHRPRCATAIGDHAIDLAIYAEQGRLNNIDAQLSFSMIFSQPALNTFAALPKSTRQAVRECLIKDIVEGTIPETSLIALDTVKMHLPFQIGGYSDFYCSLEHVQNCSSMTAGPVIPRNWFYAPSVYNGRVSSVIPSPQPVRRPRGVYFVDGEKATYGPSREIDYELEMGYFVSKPVEYGRELNISDADEHIFGFVLLNDWSARDLQVFEMKPLGPFHGKGFGTSISPWVVTMEALEPFRCPVKTKQDPAPLDHLKWPMEKKATIDIKLQVQLIRDSKTMTIGTSNLRYLYWTPFQQITHHASAGCGLGTGDLLGTGTVSGDAVDATGNKTELGCLFEATQSGIKDLILPDGSQMRYLKDGDEVVLGAWCGDMDGQGPRLGFGECRGVLLPAAE